MRLVAQLAPVIIGLETIPVMGRIVIDTLVWLLEDAFEGDPDQSLMANLQDLREEDWSAVPAGAGRSVGDILEHVGWAKWMYEDYAFGSGSLRGDAPPMVSEDGHPRPRAELLEWLREGHRRFVASVLALENDLELDRPRQANWGEFLPTRTLIRIMIGHDFYHAGEINHLRANLQGTDRWPY
jgi:uncharacterized damage-inducible protein DinB